MIGIIFPLLLPSAPSVEMVPVTSVFRISLSRPPVGGVRIDVRNNSRHKVEFWHRGFYPNHQWTLKTMAGIPVKLTKRGEIGAKQFGTPGGDGSVKVMIAGGKSHREATPPLDQAFQLKPGTYTLEVMYHEKTIGVPLKLVCPPIKVIVTP